LGAFFDVDNTLIPGVAIEVKFFRYLLRRGFVGMRESAQSAWHLLRHMPPMSLHPLRERKLYLAGKYPAMIEPLAEEFVRAEICPRISHDGLAVLEKHQQAGHRVVLVTGSLDFLIAPLATMLNVPTVLAATPERIASQYTGHVLPPLPYGEGKRVLIESSRPMNRWIYKTVTRMATVLVMLRCCSRSGILKSSIPFVAWGGLRVSTAGRSSHGRSHNLAASCDPSACIRVIQCA